MNSGRGRGTRGAALRGARLGEKTRRHKQAECGAMLLPKIGSWSLRVQYVRGRVHCGVQRPRLRLIWLIGCRTTIDTHMATWRNT